MPQTFTKARLSSLSGPIFQFWRDVSRHGGTLHKRKRIKKVLCLPEHRTPWAMSPHMKLAQYSHQCGPRNVCTCNPKRRKVSENSESFGGRWPQTWHKYVKPRHKGRSRNEHPSLDLFFPVRPRVKLRCALIFENPPPIYHTQGQGLKGMWKNGKIIGPCHQLENETLTTPNETLLCGQTQDSLRWSLTCI